MIKYFEPQKPYVCRIEENGVVTFPNRIFKKNESYCKIGSDENNIFIAFFETNDNETIKLLHRKGCKCFSATYILKKLGICKRGKYLLERVESDEKNRVFKLIERTEG